MIDLKYVRSLTEMWAKRGYVSPPRDPKDYSVMVTCKEALDTAETLQVQTVEIERLHAELNEGSFYKESDIDAMQARIERAESDRNELRRALKFYADPREEMEYTCVNGHERCGTPGIHCPACEVIPIPEFYYELDFGAKARSALDKIHE